MRIEARSQKSEVRISSREKRGRTAGFLLASVFCLLTPSFAGTHVTATYDLGPSPRVMATVNGQPQYGLVFAQRSGAVTWNNVQYGTQVLAGYLDAQGRLNDGAGNLWLDLIPNLGAVPDGTYYVVTFNIQGQVHAEIWVVPDVATATAEEVRQSQAPSAAAPAVFYQFIQKDGSDLPQRRKLNLAGAGVTCADNSGALSTDCTIPGGGGGGSAPIASPTVSGTVKIDASSADPVVYLKSSSDSLLAAKANATHTHAQADVSNLESDLAAKAPAARTISTTSPLAGGGDLSQDRTLSCPTCEVTGNKNQASGYAGLDASSKISASQASEVLGVADLTDFAGKSGSGTTAIGATITTPAADQCLVWNGSNWVNGSCAAGGGGITSLNSQTGSTQTFSKVDDTNVTLAITSATNNHQFALGWTGTLAAARLNSNVVQSVTNDTNVTGSIAAQNLTLGWTGTLAKTRQNSATAYRDEANVFTAAGGVTLDNQLGLRLREQTASGTDYIEHRAAGTLAANTTYTWPAATDSRFLFSGTAGALSWNEASGVGGCTNQFVRTLNNNAAPTCATVTAADTSGTFPPDPHALTGATHTASGLTTGQPLRATSTTAFAFGALDLANSSAVTGILGASNGGTGNAFFAVAGPASTVKTYTFPNSNATIEYQANKDAASGYAGLTAGTKLNAAQGQEVWSVADLSDYASKSGAGTTAIGATMTSLAADDILKWSGTDWVNAAAAPKATALATNGSNCSGNNFALGVDASGNAECAQPAFSNLSGSATDGQVPDNITLSQNVVTDYVDLTAIAAPATPAAGKTRVYAQTTDKNLKAKDDAGNVSVTVKPQTCSGTDKVSAIAADGTVTCSADQGGAGSGDNITVNATAAADANFNDTDPAAAGSGVNVKWQINTTPSPDNISAYVQEASGTQGGIVTTGTQTFAGQKTFSGGAIFRDNNTEFQDDADTTKKLTFELSSIATGTARTWTAPNASGEVSLLGQTIGNAEIENSAVSDAKIDATGITTRSKLPAAVAYEDEANVFTAAGGVTLDNQLGLRLRELTASGTDYIEHRATGTLAANTTYTWPAATDSRFLFSGTGGALSWNEASGVGGCTNQFVRTLNNNAAPTCATVATADISDNAIDNAKLRDSAGFSVIGKATTGVGDPADIAVAADRLLGRSGTGDLGGVQVVTNHITDANVTPAKLSTAARAVNKALSLENPATGDSLKWMMMHESHAVTLTRVYCAVLGGTSVTINVTKTSEGTPFSGGTDALTSNLVCSTSGANSTTFTSAGVAANTPLMLKITAVSGAVTNLIVGVHATRD